MASRWPIFMPSISSGAAPPTPRRGGGGGGEPVADLHAVDFERRGERRIRPVRHDVVAGHIEAERLHVIAKSGDAVERTGFGVIAELHVSSELLLLVRPTLQRAVT